MLTRALTLKRPLVAIMVHREHRMHISIAKGRVVYLMSRSADGTAEVEWDGDRFLVSLEKLRDCCGPAAILDED